MDRGEVWWADLVGRTILSVTCVAQSSDGQSCPSLASLNRRTDNPVRH